MLIKWESSEFKEVSDCFSSLSSFQGVYRPQTFGNTYQELISAVTYLTSSLELIQDSYHISSYAENCKHVTWTVVKF